MKYCGKFVEIMQFLTYIFSVEHVITIIITIFCLFLFQLKLAVVELCGASIFTEQEIVCHLIVGTADTRHG